MTGFANHCAISSPFFSLFLFLPSFVFPCFPLSFPISCRTVCSSSCIPLGRASPFRALRGLLSKPRDWHYTVFTLYFRVTYPSLTCVDITVRRVISHHRVIFKDAFFFWDHPSTKLGKRLSQTWYFLHQIFYKLDASRALFNFLCFTFYYCLLCFTIFYTIAIHLFLFSIYTTVKICNDSWSQSKRSEKINWHRGKEATIFRYMRCIIL